MSQCTCVALHHDDTTSLNMAISNFMRQGHEIGQSIRAGKEDMQLKVHSMSGGTADTHFQRHASNIHEQSFRKRDVNDSSAVESGCVWVWS